MNEAKDVIIVGGGPAGLAVANTLQDAGLKVTVYDKGSLADAVSRYPYYMRFFSTSENLELADFPLTIATDKPTREEYLGYLRRFVRQKHLPVLTHYRVNEVKPRPESQGGGFTVSGADRWGEPFSDSSRYVVIASGGYDQPRRLNVSGEELPKVSHYFTEVHPYAGQKVAVIGGGNSAVEAALLLFRAGSQVTLIHRRREFRGLKYWIQPDLENRIKAGEIKAYLGAHVHEIRPREIVIKTEEGKLVTLPNDYVLALTGYQPDATFLESMGVHVDPDTKRPEHNPETLETNIPGLYVAGIITAGNISNEVFIENSRHHGKQILQSIESKHSAG